MIPKLNGLKQQHIYFVHYFAEQSSAGNLGPAPRGISWHNTTGPTSRWCITELASWRWLLGPPHVGGLRFLTEWWLGSWTKGSKRQEVEVTTFLPELRHWTVRPWCSTVHATQNPAPRGRDMASTSQWCRILKICFQASPVTHLLYCLLVYLFIL